MLLLYILHDTECWTIAEYQHSFMLYLTTSTTGHLKMAKFLLAAGADQEHKTDEMHTALMEASMDGHVDVARLLLDSGAQVE